MRSRISRIQTQIGEHGLFLHQPLGLDIRHGHQTVLPSSSSSPYRESLSSTNAEVELIARIEEASPELTTTVNPPASDEAPRGQNKAIGKQTASLMASLVDKTQHAIITHDSSLYQHLAQIYRELGENRTQIQHLTNALAQPNGRNGTRIPKTLKVLNDVRDPVSANDDQSELQRIAILMLPRYSWIVYLGFRKNSQKRPLTGCIPCSPGRPTTYLKRLPPFSLNSILWMVCLMNLQPFLLWRN